MTHPDADDFVEPNKADASQSLPSEDVEGEYRVEADEQSGAEDYESGDYSGGRERLDRRSDR